MTFDERVNSLIDQKMNSMTNLNIPFHLHNGWDVNQLDPAVSLLGFPVLQVIDATIAPTDTPVSGTFRFYVDAVPTYRMWIYTVYQTSMGVQVGSWQSIYFSGFPASISTTTISQTEKTIKYNNINTAGWGIPAIYGSGRLTGQTAAAASVATYTVGAADGSFLISANVNVTTSTTHNFGVVITYTDETNTPRSLTLPVVQLAGTVIAAITNVTGTGPYEGVTVQIRAKAATAITITTAGTFTAVAYNVEGTIQQVS